MAIKENNSDTKACVYLDRFDSLFRSYYRDTSKVKCNSYICSLQGFLKGFVGIDFGFQALSHLWYLSFALLGYLLIAIINGTKLEKIIKNNTLKTILILFALMITLSVFHIGLGTKIAYIAVLMIAYFNSEKINRIKPIVSIILMLASILIRVIFKKICDGSFVYDEVIYSVTQATIALSIFCLVLSAKIRINKSTKVIDFLDKNTYAFYIVHYVYMIAIPHINPALNIILITIMAILSSFALTFVVNIATGDKHEK
ncbi:MAG: acyltransferase family protein [Candidatus Saccharibacteria bacterium]|nr:acyltransferase family protein [Candidatus Saccharibacteria bacterium]